MRSSAWDYQPLTLHRAVCNTKARYCAQLNTLVAQLLKRLAVDPTVAGSTPTTLVDFDFLTIFFLMFLFYEQYRCGSHEYRRPSSEQCSSHSLEHIYVTPE